MAEAEDQRSLMVMGICALVSIVVAVVAWQRWGPEVRSQEKYRLRAENISTPPQPEWIPEDVRAAVIRDGGLEELSVTDPALVEKVESAFGSHTWVARVNRVRKRPGAHVEVELEYRRPVALVEVLTEQGQRALQPVDAQGHVLPTEFLREDVNRTREFLRISAGYGMPAGPVGTPWGDPYVAGAARICNHLQDDWKQLSLYRVVAVRGNGPAANIAEYELHTRGSSRILWGHMPGQELPGEPDASTKVKLMLLQSAAQPFDSAGPVTFDLRITKTAAVPVAPQS